MEPTILLYSTRANGWFTESSTYSSDPTEAKRFPRAEALRFVARHKQKSGYNMIPVREEDIQ